MLRVFINLVFLVHFSYEGGFQKELDLNIPFPPILERRENIPTGHLRPLGWQNRPEAAIKEEAVTLSADNFWKNYVNKSQPLVIRGLIMGSDPIDKWTDIYLNRAYGHLEIKVTERKQTFQSIEENKIQMSLKKFLQNYRVEDWYLRGIMPAEMHAETPIPHLINCGPFVVDNDDDDDHVEHVKKPSSKSEHDESSRKNFQNKLSNEILAASTLNKSEAATTTRIAQLVEPYLWMSAGETSSLLHSHPEHNLHCVIDGRKYFILMSSKQFEGRTTSTDPEKKFAWRKELDLVETFKNSDEW